MTKPKDTKSSLFAGGRLLPETSPEEYQKAAREDLDVTFDDAWTADMRTQAVARAEAGLADWERRVPRIADRSGWWRVTFAGLEAPFTVGAAESRKTIIATARMAWEGTHKMKLREGEELDIRPQNAPPVTTNVVAPFAGTTSSSIGRSAPSRTEAARADGNVIQFDPTIGVKFRQTWAPSTAPMVGSRWRLTEHTNAPVPAGPWTVSSVEWRGDEEWVTLKFHAADPMERMTSRETLASFRDKFALWDEPAIARIAGDWGSPQQALEDTRRLVDEAAAEHEAEMRRLFAGPLALPSLPDTPPLPSPLDIMDGFRREQAEVMWPVLQAAVDAAADEVAEKHTFRGTKLQAQATRNLKAGEMVTAKDVKQRDYEFTYNAVFPSDGTWPDSLGEIRGSFERDDAPERERGSAYRTTPCEKCGKPAIYGNIDLASANLRVVCGKCGSESTATEPPTLETYVKEQMADVPAGWNAEMWRARVLGMLEQTADRSALPGERLRLMAEYVTRVRRGASSEMVAGLSSYVPATPRWWKGEAPPRPERMGLKRGRVTR